MAQSLDSVLADVDASDQEIGNVQPTETAPEQQQEPESTETNEGPDAIGALTAERHRVKRKYTETVADFEKRLSETNSGFEKKLTETLAENDKRWEARFNQFAQTLQPRPEPPKPAERPDVWENPDGFVDHGIKQALDPVQQQIAKITEGFSRRMAIKEHGQEKVGKAYAALHQAALSGDADARATVQRVKQSDDPFGEIVDWHSKSSVLSEFGSDPEAAIQKRLDAALDDPAFLAKAAAKLGVKPAIVPKPNSQTLPSLNRVTAAADEGDEEEDAGQVFNTALRKGVRR